MKGSPELHAPFYDEEAICNAHGWIHLPEFAYY